MKSVSMKNPWEKYYLTQRSLFQEMKSVSMKNPWEKYYLTQ